MVEPSAQTFWDELTDRTLSLDAARGRVRARLKPDETYEIPVRRGGFIYRVNFSAAVIDQMLNPRCGEPRDPRVWLEALRWGRVLGTGQRGWRKYTPPFRSTYGWEIKIRMSRYRMFGRPGDRGAWRFELITDPHAH